ncbi:MAG TPA: TonB-dependent receptor [Opitutaceae bacterium]
MTSLRRWASVLLASTCIAHAQPIALDPVFVTSGRTGENAATLPFAHVTVSGDALRGSPAVTLDGALRGVAGFSLFRRTDSLVANPTAQGVSLRGIGPSGASRSLVLLDGVPLNDPFGGWVTWSKVPVDSLAAVELVPGGGASAWGNAALGGVVQLLSEQPDAARTRFSAFGGSFGTYRAEAQLNQRAGTGAVQLLARYASTDGFSTVAPERRGPIDIPATSESRWVSARWRQPISEGRTVTVTARSFDEARGNGTPYQANSTREEFVSAEFDSTARAGFAWSARAYVQNQGFASTFSSVNGPRTAETPASDQFDVPSTAGGAAWTATWSGHDTTRTTVGVDARVVHGETREASALVGNAFTRQRYAGGRQENAGLFVLHHRTLRPSLHATAGLRLDAWRERNGHRRDTLNGALVADDRYADSDGEEWSPGAGLVWQATPRLRLTASGQQSFRRPTLNELYRPFRVGNVITDSNQALATERATSGELGAHFEQGNLTIETSVFRTQLDDAVANVTLARGPITLPGIGFVPAGGEGRRRLNLDRSRVDGASVSVRWNPVPAWSLSAQYVWSDSTIERASVSPALVGRRFAQAPEHTALAGVAWKPLAPLTLNARVRWIGEQFEDDLNTLVLADATVTDVSLEYRVSTTTSLHLSAENLTDERIETGRSADGLVNVGTPRLVLIGFRYQR